MNLQHFATLYLITEYDSLRLCMKELQAYIISNPVVAVLSQDDIIDDVEDFVAAAEILKERGAYKIYIMATHGLLSADAPRLIEESAIDEVRYRCRILISDSLRWQENNFAARGNVHYYVDYK